MTEDVVVGLEDPLGAACKAIGSYSARLSIDLEHVELILPTILGRIATLVTNQAEREKKADDQARLLEGSMDAAYGALDALLAIEPDDAVPALKEAIRTGRYGAPGVCPNICVSDAVGICFPASAR